MWNLLFIDICGDSSPAKRRDQNDCLFCHAEQSEASLLVGSGATPDTNVVRQVQDLTEQ